MKLFGERPTGTNHRGVALLGVRLDFNSSHLRGAAAAPPLIREALFCDSSNMWSESGLNLKAEPGLYDHGDLEPDPEGDWLGMIESAISDLINRDFRPLCLGGDHSITYPIIKAMAKRYGKISILHFDAHPDLYDEFQGNRYSHASPFARIMEEGLADRLVQVGIRTMNGHQREQAEKFGVEVIEMKDWREGRVFEFESPLYISFDMDGLDPAFAPGVSHREPGGLSVRQALDTIQSARARVVGADVVEFNPIMDSMNMTAVVCAKLAKEIAARLL